MLLRLAVGTFIVIWASSGVAFAACGPVPAGHNDLAISFLQESGTQVSPISLLHGGGALGKGVLVFDGTDSKLKLCDGVNWVEVGTGSGGAGGHGLFGVVQISDGSGGISSNNNFKIINDELLLNEPAMLAFQLMGDAYSNTTNERTLKFMAHEFYDGSAGYKFSWRRADGNNRINTMYFHKDGTVRIGPIQTAPSSAILSVTGTTGGFLPPQLTTVERDAVAAPAAGLMIYNSSVGALQVHNGTGWVSLSSDGQGAVGDDGAVQLSDGAGGFKVDALSVVNNSLYYKNSMSQTWENAAESISNTDDERILRFHSTAYNDGTAGYKFSWRNADYSARREIMAFHKDGMVRIGSLQNAHASATLAVTGVEGGFLPPRLTTAQRNSLGAVISGLMIYNTSLGALQVYDGTNWGSLGASGGGGGGGAPSSGAEGAVQLSDGLGGFKSLAGFYFKEDAIANKLYVPGGADYLRTNDDAWGIRQGFYKSRQAKPALEHNDEIGFLDFRQGSEAASARAALILARVDGTATASSVPGRIEFRTTRQGQSDSVNRMIITSDGRIVMAASAIGMARLTAEQANETTTGYTAEFINSGALPYVGGVVHSQNSTYGYRWITHGTSAATGALILDYIKRDDAAIQHANVMTMRAGNVGVGKDHAAYKLDVAGAVNATSVLVNGVPVASSTDTYWSLGTGGRIHYAGGNVGVGTTTPVSPLHVATAAVASQVPAAALYHAGDSVLLTGGSINSQRFITSSEMADTAGQVVAMRTRGTLAAPTPVQANDRLMAIFAQGYDGSARINAAGIIMDADGAPSTGHVPARMGFFTDNGTGYGERMRLTSDGKLGLGTQSPVEILSVQTPQRGTVFVDGNKEAGAMAIGASLHLNTNIDIRGRGVLMTTTAQEANAAWYAGVPYQGGGYMIGNSSLHTHGTDGAGYKVSSRVFIQAGTGHVGVGTVTPASKLTLNSGTLRFDGNAPEIWSTNSWGKAVAMPMGRMLLWEKGSAGVARGIGASNDGALFFGRSNANDASQAVTYDMMISRTGMVGIGGTATSTNPLTVMGDAHTPILVQRTGANLNVNYGAENSSGVSYFGRPAGGALFGVSAGPNLSSESAFYITADKAVGINTTTPSVMFQVAGSAVFGGNVIGSTSNTASGALMSVNGYGWFARMGTGAAAVYVQRPASGSQGMVQFYTGATLAGTITSSGASTVYGTTSDVRKKENITDTTHGLDTLMRIGVKDFNFIEDAGKKRVQGFIAQQLYEVYPEAVSVGSEDVDGGDVWSVDYGRVMPLAVKAIQELKVENDGLRAENAEFRARLEALEVLLGVGLEGGQGEGVQGQE